MPYKANEPHRHKIPKGRFRVDNWATFDAALRRSGELAVCGDTGGDRRPDAAPTGRCGRRSCYTDGA